MFSKADYQTHRLTKSQEAEKRFGKFGQLEFLIVATVPYGRGTLSGWCAKFEYREDAIEAYFVSTSLPFLFFFCE